MPIGIFIFKNLKKKKKNSATDQLYYRDMKLRSLMKANYKR